MEIYVDKSSSIKGFREIIGKAVEDKNVNGLFILSCDGNGFSPAAVNPILESISIPVFGGIFPAIIHGKEKMETGTIVAGLSREVRTVVIPQLSDNDADYVKIIDDTMPGIGDIKTMVVLVDGLAKRISAFINSLFTVFGLGNNYIGGGAGSLDMKQKPCLFTNRGLVRDSAVLALLDVDSGVGVSHGWEPVSGPFRVTEAKQNRIMTLEWKPAFEVYKEVVEAHDNRVFDKNNFFDIAKAYPFGIAKIGAEQVVRDPFTVEPDHSLVCVGEVPEGSYIDILKGDDVSLIRAAGKALALSKKAFKAKSQKESTVSIFMDCISRVLFLEERFDKELEAVYDENLPMIGACTIGEIANSGNDYLEFYNKTSVVGLLEAL
jgi:hypothetical protein